MNHAKQEAISRMSEFQMKIKSLSVAVITASIFVDSESWFKNAIVLVILLSLWVLDSYYLSLERKIRYDEEVENLGNRSPRSNENIKNNLFKKSVSIFHLTFIAITIISFLNSIFNWF